MRIIKSLATVAVALVVLLSRYDVSLACDMTIWCKASNKTVTCGNVSSRTVGSHTVYGDNGYRETCYITITSGPHDISCSGCHAHIGTENRICSEVHSSRLCTNTGTGLCQY